MNAEYEAVNIVSIAERKLKPGCWDAMCSNKEQRLDDARDLYEKAGNKFKLAQSWFEAGECFEKAGEIQEGKKENASQLYEEAAFCFNFIDKKRANENAQKCLKIHESSGNFIAAGKLTQKLAEDYQNENKFDMAIKEYKRAADYYQMVFSNTKSLRQNCLLKYADLMCLNDHPDAYLESKTIYHDIAMEYLASPLLKSAAKELIFKCVAIYLAYDVYTYNKYNQDSLTADAYLSKFLNECPSFADENENDLLTGVTEALKNSNELEFKKACTEYNRTNELDKWKSQILNKILSKISSQNKYADTDDYR